MTVTTLSALTQSYVGKISTTEEPAKYPAWRLKAKLNQHYGEKLIFIERPGKSDLICSGAITVGEAMKEAALLREKVTEDRETLPPQRRESLTAYIIMYNTV